MALLLSDTFTRANSTTSPGAPDVGGPYTVRVGTFGITGNQLYTPTAIALAHLTFPAASNIDMRLDTGNSSAGTSVGLVFRWVDINNYWYWAGQLVCRAAGVNSQFTPTLSGSAVGDVLRVVTFNEYITLFYNGKVVFETTDHRYNPAALAPVAGLQINTAASNRIDNVTCSDATSIYGDASGPASIPSPAVSQTAVSPISRANLYKGRSTATADSGSVA